MALSDALDLFDYWKLHPPEVDLVRIIACGLGWKPPEPPSNDLGELLAMFPGGVIRGSGHG